MSHAGNVMSPVVSSFIVVFQLASVGDVVFDVFPFGSASFTTVFPLPMKGIELVMLLLVAMR